MHSSPGLVLFHLHFHLQRVPLIDSTKGDCPLIDENVLFFNTEIKWCLFQASRFHVWVCEFMMPTSQPCANVWKIFYAPDNALPMQHLVPSCKHTSSINRILDQLVGLHPRLHIYIRGFSRKVLGSFKQLGYKYCLLVKASICILVIHKDFVIRCLHFITTSIICIKSCLKVNAWHDA